MVRGNGRREAGVVAQLLLFLVISVVAGLLLAGLALPVVGGLGLAARESADTFQPSSLQTPPLPQSSRMLAADGSLIATFYEQDRIDVPLSRVAPVMRQAIVAIEDSRFYEHGGLDLRGTLRAAVVNQRTGETQGGSSLTQQYVKNVLLEAAVARGDKEAIREATASSGTEGYSRKLRELQYAIAVEDRLTKDQILERYLNIAYFGEQAYGIEAASRRYFSRSAAQLTLPQAAYLAGLVRNPTAYDILRRTPSNNARRALIEDATNRRDTVLNRMLELGYINAKQAVVAKRTKLVAKPSKSPNGCANARQAAFFCDYVEGIILTDPRFGKTAKARKDLLLKGGITIRTSLDRRVQRAAENSLREHVRPTDAPIGTIAIVQPGTGKVLAMAASKPWGTDAKKNQISYNPLIDKRYPHGTIGAQAGSTFKVFTMVAALEQGYGFRYAINSPAQLDRVEAVNCDGARMSRDDWSPANETPEENGIYDMLSGMGSSINTYWIQMEELTGTCRPVDVARSMGVRLAGSPNTPISDGNLAFTLGVDGVTPLHMAKAYAAFAARGIVCQELAITSVRLRTGKNVALPGSDCERVMQPEIADAATYVLRGVVRNGTGRRANIDRPQAGKTGTSEGYTAWFAGYTPDLAAAVAVWDIRGRDSRYDLRNITIGGEFYPRVFGGALPAPIWQSAMEAAHQGIPETDFVEPESRFFAGTQGLGARRERERDREDDRVIRRVTRDRPTPTVVVPAPVRSTPVTRPTTRPPTRAITATPRPPRPIPTATPKPAVSKPPAQPKPTKSPAPAKPTKPPKPPKPSPTKPPSR